ncbi:MAG: TfoX/Sxy family protein [Gammaproteobacteria bacterium]|nr:TfoX/Sxy family protein [Gammaproteobacteria bacterium]MDH3562114.1 TfoX/Sxy family protein [Gammaproteobacteria bacterium]MDH5486304.1 TfoX/Sxy family protein [Gammaproteobacteria bacterium]
MSFNADLAARVRKLLIHKTGYSERKMFGGLCFMLHGNMCGGVLNDDLIVRVKPDEYAASLNRPHTRKFDFTGRLLKGFVVVRPKGCCTEKSLTNWIVLGTRCALSQPAKTAGGKRRRI